MASTMTGMDSDRQHHTRTTLTTSLDKTGSRKHSFLDVQSPPDNHTIDLNDLSSPKNDFLAAFPNALPNDTSEDLIPTLSFAEYNQHTLPPSLPTPAFFPSEGSVVQPFLTPTMSDAEALSAFYCKSLAVHSRGFNRQAEIDLQIHLQRHVTMVQLSKTLCYCSETSTDILSSLRPYVFQKKTKKIDARPPSAPQQQQPSEIPPPANSISRATRELNRKVYHLYSFQHLIMLEDVPFFYPVDLLTCLGHPDYTKIKWIHRTRLCIYASLDEAKQDYTHPVWSVVNTRFQCNRPSCWSTAVACFWNNFLQTDSPPPLYTSTQETQFRLL